MKGEKILLGISITVLAIILVLNVFLHFSIYGTGIAKIKMIAGNLGVLSNFIAKSSTESFSLITMSIEAFLLTILLAIFSIRRAKEQQETQTVSEPITITHTKSKTETDIDVFYRMIQEKKSLKMSTALKLFKIEQDTLFEWCKILENANLVVVTYPNVGEPQITIAK